MIRRLRACAVIAGLAAVPMLTMGTGTAHAGESSAPPTCSLNFDRDDYTFLLGGDQYPGGTFSAEFGGDWDLAVVFARLNGGSWNRLVQGDSGVRPSNVGPTGPGSFIEGAFTLGLGGPTPPALGDYELDIAFQDNPSDFFPQNNKCSASLTVRLVADLPPTGTAAAVPVGIGVGLLGIGGATMVFRRRRLNALR